MANESDAPAGAETQGGQARSPIGPNGNGEGSPESVEFDRGWLAVLRARLEAAERQRMRLRAVLTSVNEARARSLDALQAERAESRELRRALDAEIKRLRESLDEANEDRARLRSAREAWLQERGEFKQSIESAHTALERLRAIERSRTWRLTRPLRAVSSRLRRRAPAPERSGDPPEAARGPDSVR